MAGAVSESVPLLSVGSVEYGGIEPKVHRGYGASRIPVKPSAATGVAAGSQYQHIFEGQLGRAASQGNPLGLFTSRDKYYDSVPFELRRLPLKERQELIKPYNVPWNRESKAQFARHWKLVNPRAGQKRVQQASAGATLPFSNNIGPGNSIQPARTNSDFIAQGHDLHYQDAKEDKDVLRADNEAIGQFVQEAVGGSDPVSQLQGLVGAIGLGGKHLAERLAGKVIYGNYVFTLS